MVKSLLTGGIALAALSAAPLAASAQAYGAQPYGAPAYGYGTPYNSACAQQNSKDKATGTIIGAIVGAAAGGAIGNNVGDNDSRWHYNRYGRHGRYGYWDKGNNDGEVVAGAILGAIVGGVAGNAMASGNSTPCQTATPYGGSFRADYGSYPYIATEYSGSIPSSTDGLYGRPQDLRSHPQAAAPAPASYPAYPSYPATPAPRASAPAPQPEECRTVWREVTLPDGSVMRDPVTACRQGYNGDWEVVGENDEELYGGY
jgi:outer membrane lipoprotein SlyB